MFSKGWFSIFRSRDKIEKVDNKHLMTDPKGNSEFYFPKTLNVPWGN